METLIIIFLTIILSIFVTIYILSRKEVESIINQLNNINGADTNAKILISSSDKQFKKLSLEINKMLEEKQKTEAEYKRMDLELRQSIANISHDLRTPLTSILGYIQLLEDNGLSENEKKQYMDIVKRRAESLQILISGFYDLSRLEAKEYKFELKSLNLSNILCDLIASFYNDFLSKKITPVLDIDDSAPQVISDENAVRRIFSNLIQNVLKHGSGSVYISLKQHKDHIVTTFKNDAPDLREEDAEHLFERFFTADRTRSGKSTGLGLAITKELVEQMGHTISKEICEGKLSIIIKWKK